MLDKLLALGVVGFLLLGVAAVLGPEAGIETPPEETLPDALVGAPGRLGPFQSLPEGPPPQPQNDDHDDDDDREDEDETREREKSKRGKRGRG